MDEDCVSVYGSNFHCWPFSDSSTLIPRGFCTAQNVITNLFLSILWIQRKPFLSGRSSISNLSTFYFTCQERWWTSESLFALSVIFSSVGPDTPYGGRRCSTQFKVSTVFVETLPHTSHGGSWGSKHLFAVFFLLRRNLFCTVYWRKGNKVFGEREAGY